MTHHDLLIDTIIEHLYNSYKDGEFGELWDSARAEKQAQQILECVEEFQHKRAKLGKNATYSQWRASD